MDFLQFLSSLAWPAIAVTALIMFRAPITKLLGQVYDVSFKGLRVKLRDKLKTSGETAEKVMLSSHYVREDRAPPDKAFLELARASPASAFSQAWKDVEVALAQIRERLPNMQTRHRFESVVRELVRQQLIDGATEGLFRSMRESRDAALEAGDDASAAEAIEFRDQTRVLVDAFSVALERIPKAHVSLASG